MNAQPAAPVPQPAPTDSPANVLSASGLALFQKVDRLIKAAATRQLTKDPLFELTPDALAEPIEGQRLRWYVQRRELVDGFELRLRKALKGRGLTGQAFLAGQLAECWASLAEMGYNVDFLYWLDQAYGIRIALLDTDLSEAHRREQQDIAREREARLANNPPTPITPLRRAAREITGFEIASAPEQSAQDSSTSAQGSNARGPNARGSHPPRSSATRLDPGTPGSPPTGGGPDPRLN